LAWCNPVGGVPIAVHLTGAFFPMVCIFPKFSLSLAQISPDRESCDNEL
jgi:hypothetical protein